LCAECFTLALFLSPQFGTLRRDQNIERFTIQPNLGREIHQQEYTFHSHYGGTYTVIYQGHAIIQPDLDREITQKGIHFISTMASHIRSFISDYCSAYENFTLTYTHTVTQIKNDKRNEKPLHK